MKFCFGFYLNTLLKLISHYQVSCLILVVSFTYFSGSFSHEATNRRSGRFLDEAIRIEKTGVAFDKNSFFKCFSTKNLRC